LDGGYIGLHAPEPLAIFSETQSQLHGSQSLQLRDSGSLVTLLHGSQPPVILGKAAGRGRHQRARSPVRRGGRSPPRRGLSPRSRRDQSPRSPPRRDRSPRRRSPPTNPRPPPNSSRGQAEHKQEPWEVEIGESTDRANVSETPKEITVGRLTVKKAELASLLSVGEDDRCWAVAMSRKPWPKKLTCCNHKGEKGHEHYDSAKHNFTRKEITQVTDFKKALELKAQGRK
jgi:hypothetical protein